MVNESWMVGERMDLFLKTNAERFTREETVWFRFQILHFVLFWRLNFEIYSIFKTENSL